MGRAQLDERESTAKRESDECLLYWLCWAVIAGVITYLALRVTGVV